MPVVRRQYEKAPASTTIRKMVRTIVGQFQPERVILVGSRARGDARPDGDVDLMVVMPADSVRAKAIEIGVALHRVRMPQRHYRCVTR